MSRETKRSVKWVFKKIDIQFTNETFIDNNKINDHDAQSLKRLSGVTLTLTYETKS